MLRKTSAARTTPEEEEEEEEEKEEEEEQDKVRGLGASIPPSMPLSMPPSNPALYRSPPTSPHNCEQAACRLLGCSHPPLQQPPHLVQLLPTPTYPPTCTMFHVFGYPTHTQQIFASHVGIPQSCSISFHSVPAEFRFLRVRKYKYAILLVPRLILSESLLQSMRWCCNT